MDPVDLMKAWLQPVSAEVLRDMTLRAIADYPNRWLRDNYFPLQHAIIQATQQGIFWVEYEFDAPSVEVMTQMPALKALIVTLYPDVEVELIMDAINEKHYFLQLVWSAPDDETC